MLTRKLAVPVRSLVAASFVAIVPVSSRAADSVPGDAESLPRGVAAAEASDISDWALAGVVWSDASLTRKLAAAAARSTDDDDARARLQGLAERSENLVRELEGFGWGRVDAASNASGETASHRDDPIGERLDEFVQAKASGVKRLDTETPAGSEDPGLDDERMPTPARVDIDQYRVDDYVDETRAERLNAADATEDAIEGALAAASPEGISGPASDRISNREGWTLSSSLPYSTDSIYDSDDYDHDVDYMVENRRGADSTNRRSSDQGDADDDIDVDNPAEVITGEDELANALARGRLSERPEGSKDNRAGGTAMSESMTRGGQSRFGENRNLNGSGRIPLANVRKYSNVEDANSFDARWVQFRLDANQVRYSMTDPAQAAEAAVDAFKQLRASALVAGRSTNSEELKRILRPIVQLKIGE
ncbi:hypothetical protein [Rhodopirellula sp. SWK7]|uniref:hypothetical protein n=1 Tax=Rhodopirellula sp. SWK7 TaxID=595460 RepID=UPI0002BD8BA1|nr:hypothetical protein [Rhodopirellula sp. SWK7]EMI41091.1 signal peptide protein [Rhodopirellula sp. SWK7]